ncbi:MAG: hypothetical protein MUE41_04995 [Gemmatimonadaceae bacterium]|jgi:hypothetical protein|nr:hypothetical protein [Gemmatimonadaceae bacterium]
MYYVMTCEGVDPATDIGKAPDFPDGPWYRGTPVTARVREPLKYALDRDYRGELLAYYQHAHPLMRRDLLDALSAAGVDNLQTFAATLRDPWRKVDLDDYRAVNVIGVVRAADAERSARAGTGGGALIDADFAALTIDPKSPDGLLLFRLAENVSAIVVHERVKRTIEQRAIPGMTFYEPGEWSTP